MASPNILHWRTDFLDRLQLREPIAQSVALVLAHPDDETASASGLLQRLEQPRLIYLTDGAPRDLVDAKRAGFSDSRGYAAARKRELKAALRALGVTAEPIFYDYPDKQALDYLPEIVDRLVADLAAADVVVSHAYEHGHPDHDTAAVAVALACERLGDAAPERVEFAGYYLAKAGPVYGAFRVKGDEITSSLSPGELRAKRDAIAAFSSQHETLAQFPLSPERFRRTPTYEFRGAAPPGQALYDLYGWEITSARWRSRLAEMLP